MEKVRLEKVRLNSGGYTSDGEYFGSGSPLWYAHLADADLAYTGRYFRAYSREEAKELLASEFPGIKFYR